MSRDSIRPEKGLKPYVKPALSKGPRLHRITAQMVPVSAGLVPPPTTPK